MIDALLEQVVDLAAAFDELEPDRCGLDAVDEQLIDRLAGRAGRALHWPARGGLLQQLTKRLLESALEGELTLDWLAEQPGQQLQQCWLASTSGWT
jgi:hypothetical protein